MPRTVVESQNATVYVYDVAWLLFTKSPYPFLFTLLLYPFPMLTRVKPRRETHPGYRYDVVVLWLHSPAHYEYDPFGNTTYQSGCFADENKYRFSTKPIDDQVTGFYYYGYRFYDAENGRWINKDPIAEAGGVNLYSMVDNSVVNYIDYLGRAKQPKKPKLPKGAVPTDELDVPGENPKHPKGGCSTENTCIQNVRILRKSGISIGLRAKTDFGQEFYDLAIANEMFPPNYPYPNLKVKSFRVAWNNHLGQLKSEINRFGNCLTTLRIQVAAGKCGCCKKLPEKLPILEKWRDDIKLPEPISMVDVVRHQITPTLESVELLLKLSLLVRGGRMVPGCGGILVLEGAR